MKTMEASGAQGHCSVPGSWVLTGKFVMLLIILWPTSACLYDHIVNVNYNYCLFSPLGCKCIKNKVHVCSSVSNTVTSLCIRHFVCICWIYKWRCRKVEWETPKWEYIPLRWCAQWSKDHRKKILVYVFISCLNIFHFMFFKIHTMLVR